MNTNHERTRTMTDTTERTKPFLTYIATTTEVGPLSSDAEADRAIAVFGHLCVQIHGAASRYETHAKGWDVAVRAYKRNPTAKPPVVACKVFDKNTSEILSTASWLALKLASSLEVVTHYAAYLMRCLRIIEDTLGRPPLVLLDHPDMLMLTGAWAYGQSPGMDALLDDRFMRVLNVFAVNKLPCYAYGFPFWRNANGRCWLEPYRFGEPHPSHSTYTASDPQPTIAQQRSRFAQLVDVPAQSRCMFFSLGKGPHEPQQQALLHAGDRNARNADVLCLWPQPGDSAGCTPWSLVDEYLAARGGQ